MKYVITEIEGFGDTRIFSVNKDAEVWVNSYDMYSCAACFTPLRAMSGSCVHAKAVKRFLANEKKELERKRKMAEEMELHVYYFINRPPFIGTHPQENLVSQMAFPRPATIVGFGDRRFHGLASYSTKLTFDQIWQYELYPEDTEELDLYNQWRDDNSK